jgi:hypothetical protein
MKLVRSSVVFVIAVGFVLFTGIPAADGEPWPALRKQPLAVRLIALADIYPRSSFFANDEVFIAEQEYGPEESHFIKLMYDYLPYQQPLSSYGLNYSLVHKIQAVRDTSCDENLWEMRFERRATAGSWRYAAEIPIVDLDRRQARLRCYRTTSSDYEKAMREPTSEIPY